MSDQPASNISWTAKDRLVNPRTGQEYWGENAKSRLYPFRKNKTTWYDSDMTEKTEDFGYTYPEIDGMKLPLTTNAAKKPLQDAILRLYPSAAEFLMLSLQKVETAGQRLLPQATVLRQLADAKAPATHAEFATRSRELPDQQTLLKRSLEPKKPVLRKLAPQRKYLEWHVNLKAEKHALGGTYSVTVFLGPVEEEAVVLWPLSPYYVGSFYPFGQDTDSGCAKCQDDQRDGLQITGQIPLTLALMERYLAGLLEDISVESVVPYLTENLHWRLESVSRA